MAGPEVGSAIEMISHYMRVVYGSLEQPDFSEAVRLAARDVHRPIQQSLTSLGSVEFLTEIDISDTACIYRVAGPDGMTVEVYVSSVLPYGAALLKKDDVLLGYLTAGAREGAWPERVVSAVSSHGILLLSEAVCRSATPIRSVDGSSYMTFFEALFADETETP
jgi:hypothetical protein